MPRTTRLAEREVDFQRAVIELARACGWKVVHFRAARTLHGWRTPYEGDPQFPDLILAKAEQPVIYAELKVGRKQPTGEQWIWLETLASATGTEVYVWRPTDWPTIQARLQT